MSEPRHGGVGKCLGPIGQPENGCGAIFPIWTIERRTGNEQRDCPDCKRRPRIDLRGGGGRGCLEVLGECERWQVIEAAAKQRLRASKEQRTFNHYDPRWRGDS